MWRLLHADLKHSAAYFNWITGLILGMVMTLTSSKSPATDPRFGPNLVIMISFMGIAFFYMKFVSYRNHQLLNSFHLPLSYTQLGLVRLCYASVHWLVFLAGALAYAAWYSTDFSTGDWDFLPKLGCIAVCTHALLLICIDLEFILQNAFGKWANYLGAILTFLTATVFTFIVMLSPVEAETPITRFIQILQEPTLGFSGLAGLFTSGAILCFLSIFTYSRRRSYRR